MSLSLLLAPSSTLIQPPLTGLTAADLSACGTGEFEPHAGCWMGWPDSGYLWREGSKPAQGQYANIAKAISEFEPLTMFANKGPVRLFQQKHLDMNMESQGH